MLSRSRLSNASDFGDVSAPINRLSGCSGEGRGIFGGGQTTNVIQYITISTTGDTTDFGDLTVGREATDACGSSTRAVFGGGGDKSNVIDYVTMETTGNASDFGDLSANAIRRPQATSSAHGGIA